MKRTIDINAILAPLAGENPCGEDLKYAPTYDIIKEARRADDTLDRGEWSRDLKVAEWDKVITTAVTALSEKTKDLQIAAWLLEALIRTEGFEGTALGLKILADFLELFWDNLYPAIDEGDLEYRGAPFEFINDKLSHPLKEIPITNPRTTDGLSWLKWQESVKVGKESDLTNQWGDIDESKRKAREEQLADGKISVEIYETAVNSCDRAYFEGLMTQVAACLETYNRIDALADEKFGRDAPRLSDFKTALEDVNQLVTKLLKEKRLLEPDPADQPEEGTAATGESDSGTIMAGGGGMPAMTAAPGMMMMAPMAAGAVSQVNRLLGSGGFEEARWQEALVKLKQSGIAAAAEHLLGAACSAQSVRERTNYRLLIVKLCLQAGRHDLARPIAEELNALLEELGLARWESPIWVTEVLEGYYRCLTAQGAPDEDIHHGQEILKKICTMDITKALKYKS